MLCKKLGFGIISPASANHFPTVPKCEHQNIKIKEHLHIVTFCIEMSVTQCGRCCCVFTGLSVIDVSVSAGGDLFFLRCSHGDAPCSCYRHHFLYSGKKNAAVSLNCFTSSFFPFFFLPQETTKPDNSRNGNASRSCVLSLLCCMVIEIRYRVQPS